MAKSVPACLPTEPTPAQNDPGRLRWLVYGATKVGKSTFASGFPDPVFLATHDAGLDALTVHRVQIADRVDEDGNVIEDAWTRFLHACAELQLGRHPFKTVVVDVAGTLYRYCAAYVAVARRFEHPGDLAMGKGYDYVNTEFRRVIAKLCSLPYGIVFTAHERIREVKAGALKSDKIMPDLSAGAYSVLAPAADVMVHATVETLVEDDGSEKYQHVGSAQPTRYIDGGDRFGLLPPKFPLDYARIAELFAGEKKKGGKKTKPGQD